MVNPSMRTTFWRDLSPCAQDNGPARQGQTVREESDQRGVGPTVEGRRVHFTLSASPSQPATSSRGALGMTLSARVQPGNTWVMEKPSITGYAGNPCWPGGATGLWTGTL